MRVLLVSSKYHPEYAGSALRARNTYVRLARNHGLSYETLASSVTRNFPRIYRVDGVPVYSFALKLSIYLPPGGNDGPVRRFLKRLLNVSVARFNYCVEAFFTLIYLCLKARKFDLFHVFGENNITAAALTFAKITGKPVLLELVNIQEDPRQYEPFFISWLLGAGYPSNVMIVCISKYLHDVCLRHGYPPERLWLRPNPVDERIFNYHEQDRLECRRSLALHEPDDVVLVYLAKFRPLKNQLFLIEVMRLLPDRFKLILAGPVVESGPVAARQREYYHRIEAAVAEAGLANRVVRVPRFVEDPERYLKSADVYLMPSLNEALGTPVLEALACGVPVVANDLPGVFDQWIEQGVNGFIEPLDPAAWARRVLQAAALSREAKSKASENILAKASFKIIDKRYHELLVSLAGSGPGNGPR